MNKRRLLKLAALLEADAEKKDGIKFDLDCWAKPAGAASPVFKSTEAPTLDCNTAACAMGLACLSGAFKREGLTYRFRPWNFFDPSALALTPVHAGHVEIGAAMSLLDISEDEAGFLFLAENYPKSKTKGAAGELYVAKRIRDFVAGKVKPQP